jgi:hypothetical protein
MGSVARGGAALTGLVLLCAQALAGGPTILETVLVPPSAYGDCGTRVSISMWGRTVAQGLMPGDCVRVEGAKRAKLCCQTQPVVCSGPAVPAAVPPLAWQRCSRETSP